MTKYYDRAQQRLREEIDYQGKFINWLYQSRLGLCLQPLLTQPLFSHLWTRRDYQAASQAKVKEIVAAYQLDLSDFQPLKAANFAAFFEREFRAGRRPISPEPNVIAIAEAKLSIYQISNDLRLQIKQQSYSLAELFGTKAWQESLRGGTICLYRLAMEDYHRYLYAEAGPIIEEVKLAGKLHSIREIAQAKHAVFKENQREYCVIANPLLGPIIQMEIGALTVGTIYNHPAEFAQRGEEKGHFGLGGSSILVFYPAATIQIDQDILNYSQAGIETQVRLGERIGKIIVTAT